MTRTPASIAAQVAAEAIINAPEGFDIDTMEAVLSNARAEGVGSLYISGVEEVLDQAVTRRDDAAWL